PEGTRMIQVMLLKSLVQTTNMLTALPKRVCSCSLVEFTGCFALFLCSIISDISVLKLKVDKCSRQDNLFMKKHGQQLYRHIYLGCKEESSGQQHYETLYALLGLLSVELANEEVVVDLIRLALALQVWMNTNNT
ncbi:hypothetical protein XENOCAPTIV_002645, partial [Xenoophorus captivus]